MSSAAVDPSHLAEMMALGMSRQACVLALQRRPGDVAAACDWLFSNEGRLAVAALEKPAAAAVSVPPPVPVPAASAHAHKKPSPALGHSRLVQRAGASAAAASPVVHYSASASVSASAAAAAAPLPAGHRRGVVTKFREDKGFGFIRSEDPIQPDVFFHWSDVWSAVEPTVRAENRTQEPYFAPGDSVSYLPVKKMLLKKGSNEPTENWQGKDVRVIAYSRFHSVAKRRSQAEVHGGAVAPRGGGAAAAGSSAAQHPASVHPPPGASNRVGGSQADIAPAIPRDPLPSLIGQRLRGTISTLSAAQGEASQSRAMPHGFLTLHHVSNTMLPFLISKFRELTQQHPPVAAGPNLLAAATRILRNLSVGDVLEFTLGRDPVLGFSAEDLRPVATSLYEGVSKERCKLVAQEAAQEPMPPQLAAFARQLEPLYIFGSRLSREESKTIEFKSLTRSASSAGRSANLYDLAEKYLNGFVNSSGGILFFGVEDDGEVLGLPLNAKERDMISQNISGLMRESQPAVDPRRYAIRFIPVFRLYKSSWSVPVGDDPDECVSLGAMHAQHGGHSVDNLCSMMLQADVGDRVEDSLRFVVAVLVEAGPESVAWTRTRSRKIWVRSLADTSEMTMEQGVERERRCRERMQGDASQKEKEELLRQMREMQQNNADIVKRMVMEQMQALGLQAMAMQQQPAGAAAAAPAGSAPAAAANGTGAGSQPNAAVRAPSVVSPAASSSSASSSAFSSTSASAAPIVAAPSSVAGAQLPAGLLQVLLGMQFAESDILAAVAQLHAKPRTADLFAPDAPTEPQIAAVVDVLLGAPETLSSPQSQSPMISPRRHDEAAVPAADNASSLAAAAALSAVPAARLTDQQLSELSSIERDSEALHGPASGSGLSSFDPISVADDVDDDVGVPCELCEQLVPWAELDAHQSDCRRNKTQEEHERDHRMALELQEQMQREKKKKDREQYPEPEEESDQEPE